MTKEPKPDHFTGSPSARIRLVISTALSSTNAIFSCDMGESSSREMVRISSFLFIYMYYSALLSPVMFPGECKREITFSAYCLPMGKVCPVVSRSSCLLKC